MWTESKTDLGGISAFTEAMQTDQDSGTSVKQWRTAKAGKRSAKERLYWC